ncbi:MAG: baseplate J/gp47 family protein, partial [Nitrososphaerota archaeon]|nr:baseplate J/gp47 family protein [Nitrososphaerota archaeon]
MAIRTPQEISLRMRQALFAQDKAVSSEVGTLVRKLMDASAEVQAEGDVQNYVQSYSYDIDAKSGSELDAFLERFGFRRQPGTYASGAATFSRTTPADQDYIIPKGTQVYMQGSSGTLPQYFQTASQVVLQAGTMSVDAPAVAMVVGQAGNVAAGKVQYMNPSVGGVTSVTNRLAFTGGSDPETDNDFRARYKRDSFRSVAGTADQYRALCAASQYVSRVSVFGAAARSTETLTVSGTTASLNQSAKYVYPGNCYLTSGGVTSGTPESFFVPGVDWQMNRNNGSVPAVPSFTPLNLSALPNGKVVVFEYEYCSRASRSDPSTGLLNKVDAYVDGGNLASVTCEASTSGTPFGGGTSGWLRGDGVTYPSASNLFVPLAYAPLVSVPPTIVLGGTTYVSGVDYCPVRDVGQNMGSWLARDGREVRVPVGQLAVGELFVVRP